MLPGLCWTRIQHRHVQVAVYLVITAAHNGANQKKYDVICLITQHAGCIPTLSSEDLHAALAYLTTIQHVQD